MDLHSLISVPAAENIHRLHYDTESHNEAESYRDGGVSVGFPAALVYVLREVGRARSGYVVWGHVVRLIDVGLRGKNCLACMLV
jgi:hypothetical protein